MRHHRQQHVYRSMRKAKERKIYVRKRSVFDLFLIKIKRCFCSQSWRSENKWNISGRRQILSLFIFDTIVDVNIWWTFFILDDGGNCEPREIICDHYFHKHMFNVICFLLFLHLGKSFIVNLIEKRKKHDKRDFPRRFNLNRRAMALAIMKNIFCFSIDLQNRNRRIISMSVLDFMRM